MKTKMEQNKQFARCTSCGAVGNTDSLLERGTCGAKCEPKVKAPKADRLNPCTVILVMPDKTVISGEGTWSGTKIDDTAVVQVTLLIKMKSNGKRKSNLRSV